MVRNRFIAASVFCVSNSILLINCTGTQEKQQNNHPNILIIYADDLGYGDLSSYGSEISTPNIDKIGEEGIKFTDFYVSAPACTPSRYSLLTGSYPQRSVHNLTGALMPVDTNYLDPSEKIIPAYLKPKYKTALFGKWHLGLPAPETMPDIHGFDVFTGFKGGCIDYFSHVYGQMGHDWYVNGKPTHEEGYQTDLITNHTLDYIDDVSSSGSPFFIMVSYGAPHYGKTDPEDYDESNTTLLQIPREYKGVPVVNTLQAPPEYIERFNNIEDIYRRTYAAMVSNLDDNVGRVISLLEEKNLLNNTIIWFISDNGGYSERFHAHASNGGLRSEKGFLWEGGIRVPALMQWKEKIQGGQIMQAPVCNTDVLPTIMSILNMPVSEKDVGYIDGIDQAPLLLQNMESERTIFWKYRDQTAFRSGKWKLVDNKFLFNLESDKEEKFDVSGENKAIVEKLKNEYHKIERQIIEGKRLTHSFSDIN